jgi:uncharacterized membrane protein
MDQQVSPPDVPPRGLDLEGVLGRRVLAWSGAGAIALGLAFLVAIAVDRGLLGPSARVSLAAGASGLLVAVGGWLYQRHGRTQAALAAVGTGVCGGYLALVGATRLYDLMPSAVGLAAAGVVGLLTVGLALQWESRTLAALAIGGGLLAPVMVGADPGGLTIGFELVVLASAVGLLLWRRWEWLSIGCFALTAPQVVAWTATHPSPLAVVIALSAYCVLIAAAAIGYELRVPAAGLRASSAGLLLGGATVAAGCGYWGLDHFGQDMLANVWLAGLAVLHLGLGVAALRSARLRDEIGMVVLAAGGALANTAFGAAGNGPLLTVGWALSAVGLAALARRSAHHGDGVRLALGAQLSLATIHTVLVDVPPEALHGQGDTVGALVALSALGAGAFASARLQRSHMVSGALDVVAMMAFVFATVTALDGAALVAAWAATAVLIARLVRRDPVAVAGVTGFLAFAGGLALFLVPPTALATGVDDIGGAALAIGSLAAALLVMRVPADAPAELRPLLRTLGAAALLYLASVAVVDAFQPGDAGLYTSVDLTVRQQGQVLLSTLWALVGTAALVVGLGRDALVPRLAGFALLGLAGAKVMLVDLAQMDSIYRVLSCIALGALLLGSAFAYQRLRPAALGERMATGRT